MLPGRTYGQAPEIDGVTYITRGTAAIIPGRIFPGRIVQTAEYDLVAELCRLTEITHDRPSSGRIG